MKIFKYDPILYLKKKRGKKIMNMQKTIAMFLVLILSVAYVIPYSNAWTIISPEEPMQVKIWVDVYYGPLLFDGKIEVWESWSFLFIWYFPVRKIYEGNSGDVVNLYLNECYTIYGRCEGYKDDSLNFYYAGWDVLFIHLESL